VSPGAIGRGPTGSPGTIGRGPAGRPGAIAGGGSDPRRGQWSGGSWGGRHGHWHGRHHHRHRRGFAFGFAPYYGWGYDPFYYVQPACETVRVRHTLRNGRRVWRWVERCY
jgi:hypothetical protein